MEGEKKEGSCPIRSEESKNKRGGRKEAVSLGG